MRTLKEQKGNALIIVLLIITLIGIFTPIMINKLMNNSLQFQKAEERLQLNKLTDMGSTYTKQAIDTAGDEARNAVNIWLEEEPQIKTPPSDEKIVRKFYSEFRTSLGRYFSYKEKMRKEKFSLRIEINEIKLESTNVIGVSYTISPSLGITDDSVEEKNIKKGHKTVSINISE